MIEQQQRSIMTMLPSTLISSEFLIGFRASKCIIKLLGLASEEVIIFSPTHQCGALNFIDHTFQRKGLRFFDEVNKGVCFIRKYSVLDIPTNMGALIH